MISITTKRSQKCVQSVKSLNLIALRKAKIVYNFGLSECNRVKTINTLSCITPHIWYTQALPLVFVLYATTIKYS